MFSNEELVDNGIIKTEFDGKFLTVWRVVKEQYACDINKEAPIIAYIPSAKEGCKKLKAEFLDE